MHSLVYLLARYPGVKLVYVAPPQLSLPAEIVDELTSLNIAQVSSFEWMLCGLSVYVCVRIAGGVDIG